MRCYIYLLVSAMTGAATLTEKKKCTVNCTAGLRDVFVESTTTEYICEKDRKYCADQWEDFPGSTGLSLCYTVENETFCGCQATAYNTGSKCLNMWWLVGPAIGGGCLLLLICTTLLFCVKRSKAKGKQDDEKQRFDRERNTTDASMMNLAEFPSMTNSRDDLNEEMSDFEPVVEGGEPMRSEAIASVCKCSGTCVCKTEEETGEKVWYDNALGVRQGMYVRGAGVANKSYHGFSEYDNVLQTSPTALRSNSLYVSSSSDQPSALYDEVREFRPLSREHLPSRNNVDIIRIPRPSIIPEEPEPF